MALTIATGSWWMTPSWWWENVIRHMEAGKSRLEAALAGAREVGFTVLSMSISLIAVFIPLLLMGGIVGRFFREFSVTISVAILVSMVGVADHHAHDVRLSAAPAPGRAAGQPAGPCGGNACSRASSPAMRAPSTGRWRTVSSSCCCSAAWVALNVHLFSVVPKGFFPQQDTGMLVGGAQADQSISFQLMRQKLMRFVEIISPIRQWTVWWAYTGGGQTNSAFVFVSLKPKEERDASADQVIARLRGRLSSVPGATMFLQAMQDVRAGGRQSNAQYQFTLQSDDLARAARMDAQDHGSPQAQPRPRGREFGHAGKGAGDAARHQRDTAARLGLSMSQISNTLYDAFGQRQVSTIYAPLNQYHVVMEVAPRYWQDPRTLDDIRISTSGAALAGSLATASVTSQITSTVSSALSAATARPIRRSMRCATPARTALPNHKIRHLHGRGGEHPLLALHPAVCLRLLRAGQCAAGGEPSGPVRRLDHFLQTARGQDHRRCGGLHPAHDGGDRHALKRPRHLPGERPRCSSSRCPPSRC